jgi:hypothetical protein
LEAVLWIRIGFYADPGPALNLHADKDPDPGSQTVGIQADPDPEQTFESQKREFLYNKYT